MPVYVLFYNGMTTCLSKQTGAHQCPHHPPPCSAAYTAPQFETYPTV